MNPLTKAINELGMSDEEAMNLLQDGGIISDLCVGVDTVAEADIPAAIQYLKMSLGVLI